MPNLASNWPLAVSLLSLGCSLAGLAAGAIVLRRLLSWNRNMEARLSDLTRRLAELDRRLGAFEAPRTVTSPSSKPEKTPSTDRTTAFTARAGARIEEADRLEPRPTLISVPDLTVNAGEGIAQAGGELSQKHKEVWSLADAGLAADEIARQTGQPIGEVELIVGLHRQLHPSRGTSAHVRS